MLIPALIRRKAFKMLKKDWQTALLLSFFAEIFITILQVVVLRLINEDFIFTLMAGEIPVIDVSQSKLIVLLTILAILISPVLRLGSAEYFIKRYLGETPPLTMLFSQIKNYFKALALFVIRALIITLWSAVPLMAIFALINFRVLSGNAASFLSPIFILPGLFAFVRYFNSPFIMVNENKGVLESLKQSKNLVKKREFPMFSMLAYFMLLEFAATWILGIFDASPVISLILSQAVGLAIKAYYNISVAGMYCNLSNIDTINVEDITRNNPPQI
ncbi:MAG: hypothetical protein GYA87_00060 [Christensenellaceae bacterium]|nr:hypothetical protein [Christensenellaceae bacterium]